MDEKSNSYIFLNKLLFLYVYVSKLIGSAIYATI